jgi:hypothetical protein
MARHVRSSTSYGASFLTGFIFVVWQARPDTFLVGRGLRAFWPHFADALPPVRCFEDIVNIICRASTQPARHIRSCCSVLKTVRRPGRPGPVCCRWQADWQYPVNTGGELCVNDKKDCRPAQGRKSAEKWWAVPTLLNSRCGAIIPGLGLSG